MRRKASRSVASPVAPRSSPAGQRMETFFAFTSAQRASRKRRSDSSSTKGRCANESTWPLSTTASTSCVGPSAQWLSGNSRTTVSGALSDLSPAIVRAASTHAQAGHRTGVRLEYEQARVRLFVGVRCGQHHAFAQTELHLARRQVGDDDGELADELLGRIGRLDAAEDGPVRRLADVERQ